MRVWEIWGLDAWGKQFLYHFFVKICFHLQLVFGNKGPPKVKGNSARKVQYTNMEYNQ